jgi:integrase/recombinase XerD
VLASDASIKSEVFLSSQQTKGSKGRTLYLPKKLQKEVELYLKSRFKLNDLLAVTLTDTSRALFPNQKNFQRGFSSSTACQMFHYWYKEAKISGGSSHSGRRSYLTALATKGVHVRVLQALAGHANISQTQKYLDVNYDMLRASVEML